MDRSTHVTHDDMVCVRGMRNFGSTLCYVLTLQWEGGRTPGGARDSVSGRAVSQCRSLTVSQSRSRTISQSSSARCEASD
jgi:hypothetical protein